MSSPSEQYARFRRSKDVPVFADFQGMYDFELEEGTAGLAALLPDTE